MTMWTRTVVTITSMTCPVCGVHYGIDEDFRTKAHQAGQRRYEWFCTNGHRLGYDGVSDAERRARQAEERLSAEREWTRRMEADLAIERRRHTATKGRLTRAKNLAKAGQCLKCRRHFSNVERHYESQHGDEEREWQLDATQSQGGQR